MTRRAPNASLTRAEVAKIKLRLQQGMSCRVLAKSHGVGLETIRRINRGDTWDDVEPDPGAYTVDEQLQRQLGIGLEDRNDSEANAMAERLMKQLNLTAKAPEMPKGIAERAALFGAKDETIEQLNKGKGDSDDNG